MPPLTMPMALRRPLEAGPDAGLYGAADMARLKTFRGTETWLIIEKTLDALREWVIQQPTPDNATQMAMQAGELRMLSHLLHNLPALVLECDKVARAAKEST